MKEARGNLWDYTADATVITTNGSVRKDGNAVMGRGCALEAAQRYPDIPVRLGRWLKQFGNHAYVVKYDADEGVRVVTFPVKHRWNERADLDLIERSVTQLIELADQFHWKDVVMPRPGCGNGGLEWEDVQPRIEPMLDDRFMVVTFR